MKKAFILGSVILMFTGLFTVACKDNDGGTENNSDTSQNNTGNGGGENVGGFSLTISVENPIVKQGDDFRVNVELKNNNEEDVEIIYTSFFWPVIPGWDPLRCGCEKGCLGECGIVIEIDMPEPQLILFDAGGVRRYEGWVIRSNTLGSGTHDLRFRSRFGIYWSEDNEQPIEVWSNTIRLTVQ
jgi:hypothetical protein